MGVVVDFECEIWVTHLSQFYLHLELRYQSSGTSQHWFLMGPLPVHTAWDTADPGVCAV